MSDHIPQHLLIPEELFYDDAPDTPESDKLARSSALFWLAVHQGNFVLAQALLSIGAYIDAVHPTLHLTALHVAVGHNDLRLTKLLVEHGASFRPDKLGRWPSTMAALCGADNEMCDFIVEAEAKATVNLPD